MTESKIIAKLPALPAPEFFRDPNHTILTADGSALLTYDPATQAGFIYYLESKVWTIVAPVDFATFALHASASGHNVQAGEDAGRWFLACGYDPADAPPASASTRH